MIIIIILIIGRYHSYRYHYQYYNCCFIFIVTECPEYDRVTDELHDELLSCDEHAFQGGGFTNLAASATWFGSTWCGPWWRRIILPNSEDSTSPLLVEVHIKWALQNRSPRDSINDTFSLWHPVCIAANYKNLYMNMTLGFWGHFCPIHPWKCILCCYIFFSTLWFMKLRYCWYFYVKVST